MGELDLLSRGISDIASQIRERKISPVELTQAAISHAERMQHVLGSFITLTPELALRQAQEMETLLMRGEYLGPLHGIPIGLKDMILTEGVRTTDGGKTAGKLCAGLGRPSSREVQSGWSGSPGQGKYARDGRWIH